MEMHKHIGIVQPRDANMGATSNRLIRHGSLPESPSRPLSMRYQLTTLHLVGPRRLPQSMEQPSVLQRPLVPRNRSPVCTTRQMPAAQTNDKLTRTELAGLPNSRRVYPSGAKGRELLQGRYTAPTHSTTR